MCGPHMSYLSALGWDSQSIVYSTVIVQCHTNCPLLSACLARDLH